MKIANLIFTVAACMLCLMSCSKPTIDNTQTCTISENPNFTKGAKFQAILESAQARGLPGIALLIKNNEGVWTTSVGYADLEKQTLMQPCHVSKVASITKLFMGVLTLKLANEGKLHLDTKIADVLDAKTIKDIENADQVTIRQLLNHTTGIYDVIKDSDFYLSVLNNPPHHRNQEELLSFVRKKPAVFAAGTKAGYSNTNTLLLSMVIDKLVGDHASLLRKNIIEPLSLNNTFYYYHDKLPTGKIAQGYYDLYNNGNIVNLSSYNTGSGNGYTGLYANTTDLLTFSEALFEDKTLLPNGYLDTMLTFNNYMEAASNRYLGIGVVKDFVDRGENGIAYGHRGRDLAYSADLFYFPNQETTMVLIINYGTDGNSSLRPVFFETRDKIVDLILE